MTSHDNSDEMTGREQTEAIVEGLRALGGSEPPAPSPDLAALLTNGLPLLAATAVRRRRRVVGAGILLGGTLGMASLTGVAAAADVLPWQSQVSHVINHYTPFSVNDDRSAPPTSANPSPAPAPPGVEKAPVARTQSTNPDDTAGDGDTGTSSTSPRPLADCHPHPYTRTRGQLEQLPDDHSEPSPHENQINPPGRLNRTLRTYATPAPEV